jgi:hypothetical protein
MLIYAKHIIISCMLLTFWGGNLRQSSSGEVRYTGNYTNRDYQFSVLIPVQLVGLGDPPPAPNHGFQIRFSQDDNDWLSVVAGYDVTRPPSSKVAGGTKPYEPTGFRVLEVNQQKTILGGLNAIRILRKLRRRSDGFVYYMVTVDANRKPPNDTRIEYTITLRCPERDYNERSKILNSIMDSFRILDRGSGSDQMGTQSGSGTDDGKK